MVDYIDIYNFWLKNCKDKILLKELKDMQGNNEKIADSFYKALEFGTAGLRGLVGAGINRINKYIIIQVTKAIADYLNKKELNEKVVAITYDSRINSKYFAQLTASVFATFGIKCYITNGCKPTPYLSFLIRKLKTNMGVNITSSHNPKIYNGYKVYEDQGCQICEEIANEISKLRGQINPFEIEIDDFEDLLSSGKIKYVDEKFENEYLDAVYNERLFNKSINYDKQIVYTALNGVGEPFVTKILNKIGFNNILYVDEQKFPNGEFTTCPYPNPEFDEALKLSIEYAKKSNADIILATDPDSDRLSVVYKNENNEFIHLNGDEIGVLLTEFIFRNLKNQNKLPSKPILIRSIVTTPLVDEIVKGYGGNVNETYTGFKNLCAEIRNIELNGEKERVIFTFEEACGYLKGSYVRDKDGILACMLFTELVSELNNLKLSITDRLNEISEKYGNYKSSLYLFRFEGINGENNKNAVLKLLRDKPLQVLGGQKVIKYVDFLNQNEYNLPKSNVFKYVLEGGDRIMIRPSGTEPNLKIYITLKNDLNCQKEKAIKTNLDEILS